MRLIIATTNLGKVKEIKTILKGLNLQCVTPRDLGKTVKVKEDGKSFFENALKKAYTLSHMYENDLVVAEDSGLEVKVLGGAPGIFSKRYSGKTATDLKNNVKLLKKLKEIGATTRKSRQAQFRCVAVLVCGSKLIRKCEGVLKGSINGIREGKGGFGYDPVFYLSQYKKTVAQLPSSQKNKISHRAKAFNKLKKFLVNSRVSG